MNGPSPRNSGTSPSEPGQGLAEYALILALIAIVAIAALVLLGDRIATFISQIGTSLGG
jgi:pilus assembly protein Flp/PilA